MLLRVVGVDGTVAWISGEDIRVILPATQEKQLPGKTDGGLAIVGRTSEITASIVAWNTPGAEAIVVAEAPDVLGARVNAALREQLSISPSFDLPAEPL